MKDMLNKMMDLELGVFSLTRDKIKEVVDDLVARGEVTREEGWTMIDDLIRRGERSRENLKNDIEKTVRNILGRLDVPTRQELNDLREEIRLLRRDLTRETIQSGITDKEEM